MTQIADLVAPLVVLAENGIPTDVQELLVQGDARRGIAPGSLEKAMSIYAASLLQSQAEELERVKAERDECRSHIRKQVEDIRTLGALTEMQSTPSQQ